MTRLRRHVGRLGRWTISLLLVVIAGATATFGTSTTRAAAQSAARIPATTRAAAIHVTQTTTWVAPNGSVTTTLTVTGAPAGATLHPLLYGAIATRSAFDQTTKGRGFSGTPTALDAQPLTRGSSTRTVHFALSDGSGPPPPGAVTITGPGVHPLVFDLRSADGATLTRLSTYVVRLAAAPPTGDIATQKPLLVANSLTLDTPPTDTALDPATLSAATRTVVRSFISGIANQATVKPPTQVSQSLSFSITPELLDALATSPAASDRHLLDDLRAAIGTQPLLRVPYVGIELSSWLATPPLAARLPEFIAQAQRATSTNLNPTDPTTVDASSWTGPTRVGASGSDLRFLESLGVHQVLIPAEDLDDLSGSAFPRTLTQPFRLAVPGAQAVTAVQLDPELSAHFTNSDPALGVNQLMADLAVLAFDLPAMQRGVAIAAPADWIPSAAFLRTYLDALGAARIPGTTPLISPAPLSDLFANVPLAREAGDRTSTGTELVRSLRNATTVGRPNPALGNALNTTATQLASMVSMQPGGPAHSAILAASMNRQVDAAGSSRLTKSQQQVQLAAIRARIAGIAGLVHVAPTQSITLTAHTADLPFTIRRSANGPTVVHLTLQANDRFKFVDGSSQNVALTGTVTQLRIRVHTNSPGDTVVRVRVTSPDGVLDIATSRLVVRSTAASNVGLIITFGSLAFLLIWWMRDFIRSRRARRATRIRPADLIDID